MKLKKIRKIQPEHSQFSFAEPFEKFYSRKIIYWPKRISDWPLKGHLATLTAFIQLLGHKLSNVHRTEVIE